MRILFISNDEELRNKIEKEIDGSLNEIVNYRRNTDPLEVMSTVCTMAPKVIIIDDDYLKPNSYRILNSIKKVQEHIVVIFFTSDASLELGREISPLGIHFYGIKPISDLELCNLLESIHKLDEIN